MTDMDASLFTNSILIGGQFVTQNVELLEEFYLERHMEGKEAKEMIVKLTAKYVDGGVPREYAHDRAYRETYDYVKKVNSEIFRKEGNLHFEEWIDTIHHLQKLSVNFIKCGMNISYLAPQSKEYTRASLYDELNRDATRMNRMNWLLCNIPEDDWPKVEAFLLRMAKKMHNVDPERRDEFYPYITA